MSEIILIVQIFISVFLTGAILLQAQGTGLGATWGGGGGNYHTKRGVEKMLFTSTIVGIVLFTGLTIVSLILPR